MADYNKDPAAILDYGFDWSQWISSGDGISTSVFSADALAITSFSISSMQTMCFVGSGAPWPLLYVLKVSNRIVTNLGRTNERSFELQVINL